ncbi:hypothetical protein FACS18942_11020 [Planctomycetales bacterium]|nr:hypothetical protein FACS18942_11020 [Planctomycetales bacterium]
MVNYKGEKIGKSQYDSIKVLIHDDVYSLIAKEGDKYYAIDDKGMSKRLSIPSGFDIEEVIGYPKHFLIL